MPEHVLRPAPFAPVVSVAPFAALVAAAVLLILTPGPGAAQDVALDRWLVTAGPAAPPGADDPLGGVLPDRDLDLGPGYWELVRQDGAREIRVSDRAEAGEDLLAHAYLRVTRDATVRLVLAAGCDHSVWLNGQPLEVPAGGRDVRLGLGWNRLLVAQPARCETVGGGIGPSNALAPKPDDDEPPLEVRVQASRPPGASPSAPQGTVAIGQPAAERLVWRVGNDRLLASLAYDVTSWGRTIGPIGGAPTEAREGEPELDLTGDWNLTLYSPTGIQRLRAELEMTSDGRLTGRLTRRDGQSPGRVSFAGDVRDGWVAGDRFGWTMRLSIGNRFEEVTFEGTAANGRLDGTVRFDDTRDFESRFEAERAGQGEVGPPGGGERAPGARPERQPFSAFGPGPDPSGLRARMIRQLRGPIRPSAPAPRTATFELRVAGERTTGSASGLAPGLSVAKSITIEFRKAREAALEPDGVEARIRWEGDDIEVRGSVDAASLLEALHAPIAVEGLSDGATVELRVPETLNGFTVRGLGGEWSVGGTPATDGTLCDPCRRGDRLRVSFRASGTEGPSVQITDSGYPDAVRSASSTGRTAIDWLRALEGDNRRYRALGGGSTP